MKSPYRRSGFDDSVIEIEASISGVRRQLGEELAPTMKVLIEDFAAWARDELPPPTRWQRFKAWLGRVFGGWR